MKIVFGLLALVTALAAVTVLAVVQMAIKLAPLLLVVAVVMVVRRGHHHHRPPAPRRSAAIRSGPALPMATRPAAGVHGSSAPVAGGWVLMPVWVPAPAASVLAPPKAAIIDGEVINEQRHV